MSSGRQFLVDTQAEVSVFPATGHDTRTQQPDGELQTANGSTCRSFGTRKLKLTVYGRVFIWPFEIPEVTQPLLGADFLCDKGLMVDLKGKRLVESTTFRSCQLQLSDVAPQRLHYVGRENDYAAILSSFPDLLTITIRYSFYKAWGDTCNPHLRATSSQPSSTSSTREAQHCQRRVPFHGGHGNNSSLKQSVVSASAYGAQELW